MKTKFGLAFLAIKPFNLIEQVILCSLRKDDGDDIQLRDARSIVVGLQDAIHVLLNLCPHDSIIIVDLGITLTAHPELHVSTQLACAI
nr:hypothetical protein [Roseiconus lacunae]